MDATLHRSQVYAVLDPQQVHERVHKQAQELASEFRVSVPVMVRKLFGCNFDVLAIKEEDMLAVKHPTAALNSPNGAVALRSKNEGKEVGQRQKVKIDVSTESCQICLDTIACGTGVTTCGRHFLCRSCVPDSLEHFVDNWVHQNVVLSCLAKDTDCHTAADFVEFVTKYTTRRQRQSLIDRYLKQFVSEYVVSFTKAQIDERILPCPSVDCTSVFSFSRSSLPKYELPIGECPKCSSTVCLGCGKEGHHPVACDELAKWAKWEHVKTTEWIHTVTKKCPFCHQRIEKNEGCDHMTCKCGKQFCWLCSKAWSASHSCNKNTKPQKRGTYSNEERVSDAVVMDFAGYDDHRQRATRIISLIPKRTPKKPSPVMTDAADTLLASYRTLPYTHIYTCFHPDDEPFKAKSIELTKQTEALWSAFNLGGFTCAAACAQTDCVRQLISDVRQWPRQRGG